MESKYGLKPWFQGFLASFILLFLFFVYDLIFLNPNHGSLDFFRIGFFACLSMLFASFLFLLRISLNPENLKIQLIPLKPQIYKISLMKRITLGNVGFIKPILEIELEGRNALVRILPIHRQKEFCEKILASNPNVTMSISDLEKLR